MSSTAAFPLWINDVPVIKELQCLHQSFHEHEQHDSTTSAPSSLLNIRDLFRCNTDDPQECWRDVLLSSYMTDLQWLLKSVPELSAVTEKVVILSGDKGTATLRWVKGCYLPTSAAQDRVNPFLYALRAVAEVRRRRASGGVASSSSVPPVCLTRDRFAAVEPPLPIAFGTHHTKMAICANARGVRVCIFTANLLEQDWCWKTQGIYIQDFPWDDPVSLASASPHTKNAKAHDFEQQLRQYLAHCGIDMTTPFSWEGAKTLPLGIFNTNFLAHLNFAEVKVWLVSSVPGMHAGGEASPGYSVGMCRLSEVIRNASMMSVCRDTPIILTWQYSSQGSLNSNFLNLLQRAMCGALDVAASVDAKESSAFSPPLDVQEVQIIYPTETEVRNSFEGWRGGCSLPVRLQCCNEFVNERLHRWGCPSRSEESSDRSVNALGTAAHDSRPSSIDVDALNDVEAADRQIQPPCAATYRQYAMPHIKSYAAVHADRTHLHWYLLTSANLSQAAWGSLSANTTKKTPRRLLVRSYELGVLYDPTSAVSLSKTPWFSVVTPPCIHLPTLSNSNDSLFATPLGERISSKNIDESSAPPSLFLPCDMRRPEPYESTAALRARRRSISDGAAPLLSRRDVPWVVDIPHDGVDAYGRDVDEAFEAEVLPPLSLWRPSLGKEELEKTRLATRKRMRD